VLGQTFACFELLISDNASADGTEDVGRRYAQADSRVRYFRQPANLGPIGNFNWLLAEASSEFVLMIADDDWLDPDYLESCIALMDRDPSLSIVTGAARYYDGEDPVDVLLNTDLMSRSAAGRVLRYLHHSWSSAAFYGLMRTSAVRAALPIPNVMGADWLFVSALAFAGRVVTTPDTHLNRKRGGTSANFERIAEVSGLSRRAARNPHLAIAFNQFRHILSAPPYQRLARSRRIALGVAAVAAIVAAHPLDVFWDAVGPIALHPSMLPITGPVLDRVRARRARRAA
jgi:glycosyltransferase involved in cell wall biosynthesis